MTEKCPHCGSEKTFTFKSDIYIVEGKDFIKKPFYGCMDCKSAFVIIEKKEIIENNIKTPIVGTNVQKTLSRLSKGCMGVLENIK